jgi:mannose-1-phosphate guanylyltransferase
MAGLIVPVVLAGGQGTRLWPLSRSARPKQFLPLNESLSLFQDTLRRVTDPQRYAAPLILTNEDYRFVVAEQAQDIGAPLSGILLEPVARNTAVAIAVAAVHAERMFGPDAVLHVLPSDHAVTADPAYWTAVDLAATAARDGRLVTFGIVPTVPETGYGYIKVGSEIASGLNDVERFVEKPELARAEAMLAEGGYLWNSGMFMLSASALLAETRAVAPATHEAAVGAVDAAKADLDFIRLGKDALSAAPDISIDHAIFEKTKLAAVVPVSSSWSDLGSWDAVWKIRPKDEHGNVAQGDVSFSATRDSLVVSERAHVAIEGLEDIAVIASDDAIFVGRLSQAQKVGQMVKRLRAQPQTRALTEIHKTAYRPWGGYSSVLMGPRFQVKRLFVKPGKKLSLQRHHHRAEHWIVVAGTAEVTVDGQVTILSENQSIYLPLGCTHRLANPGKILLELIEVQTGSYLGEDDIVRIEDEFGRA